MQSNTDPLKVILLSTLFGTLVLELLLLVSIIFGNSSAVLRSIAGIIAVAYVVFSILVYRNNHPNLSAWLITIFYFLIGTVTAFIWGINAPVAILILSFSLLLSALILPIKYIFINTSAVVGVLCINQIMVSLGFLSPLTSSLASLSTFADLFIYTIIFIMFAVLTWLFAKRINTTFQELSSSKKIIERQNSRISQELRLEKRRLRLAEIAKTSQLAAFSDIGQYTSLLMHDLSNELAILKMRDETNSSTDFNETAKIIDEIERLIERSRRALLHKTESKKISEILEEISLNFQYYCEASKVELKVKLTKQEYKLVNAHLVYQVLSIVVKNAIDAYSLRPVDQIRNINIISSTDKERLIITIQDWAGGIPGHKDNRVFNGLTSTKKNGHGIGLHLCKLIVEEQLNGKILYEKRDDSSLFTVFLPVKK